MTHAIPGDITVYVLDPNHVYMMIVYGCYGKYIIIKRQSETNDSNYGLSATYLCIFPRQIWFVNHNNQ